QYARAHPGPYPLEGIHVPSVVLGMAKLGVGYGPETERMARAAGLLMIARPMPDYLLTTGAIEETMRRSRLLGDIVLFNGVTVAGGKKLAKVTAEVLQRNKLQFAFVELVPQEGDSALASALRYQIIRTHSISQEEMAKTSATRGLDRFTLGVTERGIRLCYVRLLLNPQPDLVAGNVAYLRSIHDALAKAGYDFGDPHPYRPLSVPHPALALLALGVVGGGLWLMMEMLRPRDCWFWWLLGLGAVGAAGGGMAAAGMVQALFPLLAAVVFPTLAVLLVASVARGRAESWGEQRESWGEQRESWGVGAADGAPRPEVASVAGPRPAGTPRLLRGMALVVLAAAVTALGGLMIAGMLSSSGYMTQIAQFRGVKLAQLLPLLLVLVVMIGRTYGSRSVTARTPDGRGENGWPLLRRGLIAAAEAVVKYWHAVAVFLVLGLVAFMIMRSGNESAVEVSGLELKLRALLDQILVVRPRTKEIVFGFPALLLGLSLLLHGRPRTAWVWLTLGAIGLISMTNTFCHLHTPLLVSLLRVANGIWVGLLVGLLWCVAKMVGERLLRSAWGSE
ncbi:MAG: hypothetical protein KKI08_13145, partial [Armatimonadetes bacterium]|nr:hypothetical protein [Armatimonadota bacterium]